MAASTFHTGIPTTNGNAQTQLNQMSSNFAVLRNNEFGDTVANAAPGMVWADNVSTDVDLYMRNKDDSGWRIISFSTGTRMLFNNISAPVGWAIVQEDFNDAAIRAVNDGTDGSGWAAGVDFFETVQGANGISGSASAFTLTTAHMPAHTHSLASESAHTHGQNWSAGDKQGDANSGASGGSNIRTGSASQEVATQEFTDAGSAHTHALGSNGGGSAHTHVFGMKYCDIILAQISSIAK